MKIAKNFMVLFLSAVFISSCANKQAVGTGAGAIVGGLLGSQFGKGSGQVAMAVIGAGAGALIGGEIGRQLDEKDKQLLNNTSQKALETAKSGVVMAWKNPDSGNYGRIIPEKTYQNATGEYCREYSQTIVVGGKTETAYGKACRKPDGQWQIIQ